MTDKGYKCSFCGKSEYEVDFLYSNDTETTFICNECIADKEVEFLEDSDYEKESKTFLDFTPKEIKKN